jgi:hypothetical protein
MCLNGGKIAVFRWIKQSAKKIISAIADIICAGW